MEIIVTSRVGESQILLIFIAKSQIWSFLIAMMKIIQKDTERFMLQAGNWQINYYINFFPVSNWLHFISIQAIFFFFFLGEISIQAIIVKDLLVYVWIGIKFSYIWRFVFSFFFFFYLCVSDFRRQSALFMYCSRTHNHFI